MKKIILVSINAKYIHSNPAIRSLEKSADYNHLELLELTINDRIDRSFLRLMECHGDAYGFSCYLWNLPFVKELSEMLKKAIPDVTIFLGGPEVSFEYDEIFNNMPWIDYIFVGESEENFPEFVRFINGQITELPEGIAERNHSALYQTVNPLDNIPFFYSESDLQHLGKRIIYYESMRGCPFNCSYCLSSSIKRVRFLPLKRVFRELDLFIQAKVKQVKFVDRTFNVDIERCNAILDYLAHQNTNTNFHFEIAGDLIDRRMIDIVKNAPKGRFQFEIGIQSTHEPTLEAVTRKTDTKRVLEQIKELVSYRTAHIHVDLIAGLPFEDYSTFSKSFNDVYNLHADMLQLGFLKLLKGTAIRSQSELYHYQFRSFPPYEVISNDFISSYELLKLKKIEVLIDNINNAGRLSRTIDYILFQTKMTPFHFFESLSDFATEHDFYLLNHGENDWYQLVFNFTEQCFEDNNIKEAVKEFIAFDYLLETDRVLPAFLEQRRPKKEQIYEILMNDELIKEKWPELLSLSVKKRMHHVLFQKFEVPAELSGLPSGSIAAFYQNKYLWITE